MEFCRVYILNLQIVSVFSKVATKYVKHVSPDGTDIHDPYRSLTFLCEADSPFTCTH